MSFHSTISDILQCSIDNVSEYWHVIRFALLNYGIYDKPVVVATLATIGTEVPDFAPIPEYASGWEYEGRVDLGNIYPGDGPKYRGRGFIQLTGRSNYRTYGNAIGIDLETYPDLALDPGVAAAILAVYFVEHGAPRNTIPMNARLDTYEGWREVRRLVNGGYNGWDVFWQLVTQLNERIDLADDCEVVPSDALAMARKEDGKPYSGPVVGEPEEARHGDPGWDCSSLVADMYKIFGVSLIGPKASTPFTDDIAQHCFVVSEENAQPGDIILYRYYDPSQRNVTYPHVGFYVRPGVMFDAQYGLGVGEHPILPQAYEIRRVNAASTEPVPAPEPEPEPDDVSGIILELQHQLAEKQKELESLITVVGYLTGDVADKIEKSAQEILTQVEELRRHKLS